MTVELDTPLHSTSNFKKHIAWRRRVRGNVPNWMARVMALPERYRDGLVVPLANAVLAAGNAGSLPRSLDSFDALVDRIVVENFVRDLIRQERAWAEHQAKTKAEEA